MRSTSSWRGMSSRLPRLPAAAKDEEGKRPSEAANVDEEEVEDARVSNRPSDDRRIGYGSGEELLRGNAGPLPDGGAARRPQVRGGPGQLVPRLPVSIR